MLDMVLTHKLTETYTLGNGKKINTMLPTINVNVMDKVLTHMLTEIFMLESGKKVYDMEKELLHIQMEKLKRAFGKKIN